MAKRNTKIYDVAIVGAGPAGMTAAIYAGRSDKQVIVMDKDAVLECTDDAIVRVVNKGGWLLDADMKLACFGVFGNGNQESVKRRILDSVLEGPVKFFLRANQREIPCVALT